MVRRTGDGRSRSPVLGRRSDLIRRRSVGRLPVARPVALAAWALLWAGGSEHASGQDLATLATECAGSQPALTAWCQELALAGAALQRTAGLASGLAGPVPGSPSTVGLRLGSAPRVTAAVAPFLVRVGFPDLTSGDGTAAPPGTTASVVGVRTSAAVGVVDGWQLAPTVGGVFSVDLLADWSWVRYPGGEGFDGGGPDWGWGPGWACSVSPFHSRASRFR